MPLLVSLRLHATSVLSGETPILIADTCAMLNIILLLYSATGCEESVPLVPPLQPRHSCGQKDNLSIPPEFMYCLSTSSSTSRMRVNICTYKGGVCIIDMCTYIMGKKRMHKYRYKNGGYISKGRICICVLRIYTHTCTPLSTHTNIHAHENPGSVLHPPPGPNQSRLPSRFLNPDTVCTPSIPRTHVYISYCKAGRKEWKG